MTQGPLMPKATAVWLVENTSLAFEQIADFCKLHPLEVKGIADGEVAAGIKGFDPITAGQLRVLHGGDEVAVHDERIGRRQRAIDAAHFAGVAGSGARPVVSPRTDLETKPPAPALLRPLAEYETAVGRGSS